MIYTFIQHLASFIHGCDVHAHEVFFNLVFINPFTHPAMQRLSERGSGPDICAAKLIFARKIAVRYNKDGLVVLFQDRPFHAAEADLLSNEVLRAFGGRFLLLSAIYKAALILIYYFVKLPDDRFYASVKGFDR